MGLMILLFLPSFPFSATFLTPRERAIAQARLNRDQKPQSHGGMTGWEGFKAVVSDINSWLFMLVYAGCQSRFLFIDLFFWLHSILFLQLVNVGVATVSYFLPTVSFRNLEF